uniref:Uncharacterized protein n=1 Tax=Chromera velia CCMP2878 TaxID=1169474 RepID=A0A0G4F9B0_9ALVE
MGLPSSASVSGLAGRSPAPPEGPPPGLLHFDSRTSSSWYQQQQQPQAPPGAQFSESMPGPYLGGMPLQAQQPPPGSSASRGAIPPPPLLTHPSAQVVPSWSPPPSVQPPPPRSLSLSSRNNTRREVRVLPPEERTAAEGVHLNAQIKEADEGRRVLEAKLEAALQSVAGLWRLIPQETVASGAATEAVQAQIREETEIVPLLQRATAYAGTATSSSHSASVRAPSPQYPHMNPMAGGLNQTAESFQMPGQTNSQQYPPQQQTSQPNAQYGLSPSAADAALPPLPTNPVMPSASPSHSLGGVSRTNSTNLPYPPPVLADVPGAAMSPSSTPYPAGLLKASPQQGEVHLQQQQQQQSHAAPPPARTSSRNQMRAVLNAPLHRSLSQNSTQQQHTHNQTTAAVPPYTKEDSLSKQSPELPLAAQEEALPEEPEHQSREGLTVLHRNSSKKGAVSGGGPEGSGLPPDGHGDGDTRGGDRESEWGAEDMEGLGGNVSPSSHSRSASASASDALNPVGWGDESDSVSGIVGGLQTGLRVPTTTAESSNVGEGTSVAPPQAESGAAAQAEVIDPELHAVLAAVAAADGRGLSLAEMMLNAKGVPPQGGGAAGGGAPSSSTSQSARSPISSSNQPVVLLGGGGDGPQAANGPATLHPHPAGGGGGTVEAPQRKMGAETPQQPKQRRQSKVCPSLETLLRLPALCRLLLAVNNCPTVRDLMEEIEGEVELVEAAAKKEKGGHSENEKGEKEKEKETAPKVLFKWTCWQLVWMMMPGGPFGLSDLDLYGDNDGPLSDSVGPGKTGNCYMLFFAFTRSGDGEELLSMRPAIEDACEVFRRVCDRIKSRSELPRTRRPPGPAPSLPKMLIALVNHPEGADLVGPNGERHRALTGAAGAWFEVARKEREKQWRRAVSQFADLKTHPVQREEERRGEKRRGEERRGEKRRGEKRRGEERRGEKRRGEKRRGEERRGEKRREEERRGEERRGEERRGEERRGEERRGEERRGEERRGEERREEERRGEERRREERRREERRGEERRGEERRGEERRGEKRRGEKRRGEERRGEKRREEERREEERREEERREEERRGEERREEERREEERREKARREEERREEERRGEKRREEERRGEKRRGEERREEDRREEERREEERREEERREEERRGEEGRPAFPFLFFSFLFFSCLLLNSSFLPSFQVSRCRVQIRHIVRIALLSFKEKEGGGRGGNKDKPGWDVEKACRMYNTLLKEIDRRNHLIRPAETKAAQEQRAYQLSLYTYGLPHMSKKEAKEFVQHMNGFLKKNGVDAQALQLVSHAPQQPAPGQKDRDRHLPPAVSQLQFDTLRGTVRALDLLRKEGRFSYRPAKREQNTIFTWKGRPVSFAVNAKSPPQAVCLQLIEATQQQDPPPVHTSEAEAKAFLESILDEAEEKIAKIPGLRSGAVRGSTNVPPPSSSPSSFPALTTIQSGLASVVSSSLGAENGGIVRGASDHLSGQNQIRRGIGGTPESSSSSSSSAAVKGSLKETVADSKDKLGGRFQSPQRDESVRAELERVWREKEQEKDSSGSAASVLSVGGTGTKGSAGGTGTSSSLTPARERERGGSERERELGGVASGVAGGGGVAIAASPLFERSADSRGEDGRRVPSVPLPSALRKIADSNLAVMFFLYAAEQAGRLTADKLREGDTRLLDLFESGVDAKPALLYDVASKLSVRPLGRPLRFLLPVDLRTPSVPPSFASVLSAALWLLLRCPLALRPLSFFGPLPPLEPLPVLNLISQTSAVPDGTEATRSRKTHLSLARLLQDAKPYSYSGSPGGGGGGASSSSSSSSSSGGGGLLSVTPGGGGADSSSSSSSVIWEASSSSSSSADALSFAFAVLQSVPGNSAATVATPEAAVKQADLEISLNKTGPRQSRLLLSLLSALHGELCWGLEAPQGVNVVHAGSEDRGGVEAFERLYGSVGKGGVSGTAFSSGFRALISLVHNQAVCSLSSPISRLFSLQRWIRTDASGWVLLFSWGLAVSEFPQVPVLENFLPRTSFPSLPPFLLIHLVPPSATGEKDKGKKGGGVAASQGDPPIRIRDASALFFEQAGGLGGTPDTLPDLPPAPSLASFSPKLRRTLLTHPNLVEYVLVGVLATVTGQGVERHVCAVCLSACGAGEGDDSVGGKGSGGRQIWKAMSVGVSGERDRDGVSKGSGGGSSSWRDAVGRLIPGASSSSSASVVRPRVCLYELSVSGRQQQAPESPDGGAFEESGSLRENGGGESQAEVNGVNLGERRNKGASGLVKEGRGSSCAVPLGTAELFSFASECGRDGEDIQLIEGGEEGADGGGGGFSLSVDLSPGVAEGWIDIRRVS